MQKVNLFFSVKIQRADQSTFPEHDCSQRPQSFTEAGGLFSNTPLMYSDFQLQKTM